jgi:arylsulfatase
MGCTQQNKDTEDTKIKDAFKSTIKLYVRESVSDWTPFLRKRSPEVSLNILFVLYDDAALAAWSPYGVRIR